MRIGVCRAGTSSRASPSRSGPRGKFSKRPVCEIEVGRLIGVYSDPERQTVETSSGERSQYVNLCFEGRVVGEVGSPPRPKKR